MKQWHTRIHDNGVFFWYGEVEDDYGQWGIINGSNGIFYYVDLDIIELVQDDSELKYLIMELPQKNGKYGESDDPNYGYSDTIYETVLYKFIRFLSKYNKDKYDIIKGVLTS